MEEPDRSPDESGGPDRDQLTALVRGSVGPLGIIAGGTRRVRPLPGARDATALDTRHLTRVVEYDPAEMVVTVEAGVTWDALDAILAPNQQRLGVRPALPAGATLGGLVAADACGTHRARHGSWRDTVLGLRLLLADGREVRAGGKVVKNVAGYDLVKLAVGSNGCLGLITELSLRLHPRPESTLVGRRTGEGVAALVAQIRQLPVEPAGLIVCLTAGRRAPELAVALEGREAAVAAQRAVLESGAPGWVWEDDTTLGDDLDEHLRQARAAGAAVLRGGCPEPMRILDMLAGTELPPGTLATLDPAAGEARWYLPAEHTAFALDRRRALESAGGFLTIEEGLPGCDPHGTPPEGAFLADRIKKALDPAGRWRPAAT